jgi:hypothetical protein
VNKEFMGHFLKYIKIPYLTLGLIIIWDPLRTYFFPISGYGYILLFFVSLGVLYEMRFKSFWKNLIKIPYFIWLVWIFYSLINTFFIHSYNSGASKATFIFFMFQPLFVILIISNNRYNYNLLINLFIWAFFIRVLLSLFFDAFTIMGRDEAERLGEEFNANAIAFGALFLIVCIGFKKIFLQQLSFINYLQLIVGLWTIGATSSRKTLIALTILVLGYIYINRSKDKFKRYLKYAFAIAFLLFAFLYVLNNSAIGHRFIISYYKTVDASSPEKMFDGRMGQYIQGTTQFKHSPINGVGLNNFGNVGPVNVTAHSEFIVQFAECGIIGVIIWFLFYRKLLLKLFKIKKLSLDHKKTSEYLIFFLFSMFFLMVGAWVYNMAIYWIPMGLLIKFVTVYNEDIILS